MKVQDELSGTENRINVARLDFNQAVTDYNTTRNSFPAVLDRRTFGLQRRAFLSGRTGVKNSSKYWRRKFAS